MWGSLLECCAQMGQQKKIDAFLSSKPRTIPIQDELNSECLRPRNSSISRLLRDLRLSRRSARAFLFYGRSRSLSRSFARSLCRRRRRLTLLLLLPRVYILFSGTTDRRRLNPSATCRTCVQRHLRLNTCHHRKGNIERCTVVGKHRAHCLNTWPRARRPRRHVCLGKWVENEANLGSVGRPPREFTKWINGSINCTVHSVFAKNFLEVSQAQCKVDGNCDA